MELAAAARLKKAASGMMRVCMKENFVAKANLFYSKIVFYYIQYEVQVQGRLEKT